MSFNQDGYSEALGLNDKFRKNQPVIDLARYEMGGLSAKVIDLPADLAISRGVEIVGDKNNALLYELERLEFLPHAANAVRWSRLFGGAAIVLITDDGLLNEPLNVDRMTKISELRVFGLDQISPTAKRYLNPKKANLGQYESYHVSTALNAQIEVHESRMIFVSGDALPERLKDGIHWKGRSVANVFEKVSLYENGLRMSNEILKRKQQPVHRMKGLSTAIQNGLEQVIRQRVTFVEQGRNSLNAVVVDSDDEYSIINADLGGVVDILDELKVAISADVSIPVSVLFGQSAKGLNATGDNDFEGLYDLCESIQQNKIKPAAEKLLEIIIKQKHIKNLANNDWKISFPSLKTPTDQEAANVEKIKAETENAKAKRFIDLVDIGAMSANEVREQYRDELGLKGVIDDEDQENQEKAQSVALSDSD